MNLCDQKQKVSEYSGASAREIRTKMIFVVCFCMLWFVVVMIRVSYLHLSNSSELTQIAKKQYNAKIPISMRRGRIFDRNGSELATSLPVPSIYVDPLMVEDKDRVARELARILELDGNSLRKKLDTDKRFVWIKRNISYDKLKEVMDLKLPGVSYIEESKRFYPNGELASQLLGAVGFDSQPLGGIEMAMNQILLSKKDSTYIKRDARGRLYAVPVTFGEQSDVGEVYLTIDKQIQFIAETALREGVKAANASDGVAVVMDANTGEVLAMVSAPIFDPNNYSKYPPSSWRNRAVTDVFEPGSTFKVFIISAALEAGVVTPDTEYDCSHGAIQIGDHVLHDVHPYGVLPVRDIIKFSSNIGALKVAFDLGRERVYSKLREFGFGVKPGTDLPGEVAGFLGNYTDWEPVRLATIAFGQGVAASPLQMAAAFAAVVNGGIYHRPRVISRIVDRDGHIFHTEDEILAQPISGKTSAVMRSLLRRVVEVGGTGVKAKSDIYDIGGKTGTAQKVVGGRYIKGRYYSSFIGFAPVDDPKIVVLVGIDEPRGAYYGGVVAAPVVREIIEKSLGYLGVPTSKSPIIYAKANAVHPNYSETERRESDGFRPLGDGVFVTPDLKGLTLREAISLAEGTGIDTDTRGSGVVVEQRPLPGEVIKAGEKLSLNLMMP